MRFEAFDSAALAGFQPNAMLREPELMHAIFCEDSKGFLAEFARMMVDEDGRVMAVCGTQPVRPGVLEVWGVFSKHCVERRVSIARLLVKVEQELLRQPELHRLQAVTHVANAVQAEFFEDRGWKREGRLNGYAGIGQDFWMYAKLKGEA